MKLGGLFTALGILIVLGGLVWYSNKHPATDAKATPATTKLITLKPEEIEQITIAKAGADPIALAKLAGNWEIVKPAPLHADQDAVAAFTSTMSAINTDRLIDEHPANLDQFGLASPTLEIDVSTKNGKTSKVLFGSDNPSGSGTYAKVEGDPKVYTVPVYMKGDLNKTIVDLRDKRLLTFNQDKLTSVSLASASKGSTVEFAKNAQGDWQIVKPKPLRADGMLVDDLIRKLNDTRMDLASADSDAKAAAAQFASGTKSGVVTTTDNTGNQTLEIRKGKNNYYYAKSSVIDGIYKLGGDLGASMDKTAEDFRNKKLFDFGFNDPTKIEINGMAYQRAGDKWTMGSAQYDPGSMQGVIDKLRDLSAAKFADKMGGTQTLVLGVTSGDNHRYEKVTINKDGDAFDAQRDGEQGVYVIDAKSMDDVQKAVSGIKPYQAPKNEKKKIALNGLLTDLYQLTMAAGYFAAGKKDDVATFEFTIRRLPRNRDFVLIAGLHRAVEYLLNLSFDPDEIAHLRGLEIFRNAPNEFWDYLAHFRFSGNVFAVPEGTVLYEGQPVLNIRAPLIEAQIPETYLLSAITFETLIASKAARIAHEARDRTVIEFGTRRAHTPEAGVLGARAAYIGGCAGTSNVQAGYKFGIPVMGTAAHSWVMSFESEIDSFRELQHLLGDHTIQLIDTYDTIEGARAIAKIGRPLWGVRLDSGDFISLSRAVRRILDDAGLCEARIMVSGDLDEAKIAAIVEAGAPVDAFGVGTELATSADAPSMAAIYKLVEIDSNGTTRFTAKDSPEKQSLPGAKQLFRYPDFDLLGLHHECAGGSEAMLKPVIVGGNLIEPLPSVEEIRTRAQASLAKWPEASRRTRLSPALEELNAGIRGAHVKK